jgi:cytochrome c553
MLDSSAAKKKSEEYMKLPTLADMSEKWKEEEMKEGAETERERLAIELLKENFTDEQAAKLTKLSPEEI